MSYNARIFDLEKKADKCKWDLFYLCREVLHYELMEKAVHGDLCKYAESLYPAHPGNWQGPAEKSGAEMEDQFKQGNSSMLLLMPRGTFKSSVITVGFTLQQLLHDPNIRILIDSETVTKSGAFLTEIKGHLEKNPDYREVFHFIHGIFPNEGRKKELLWTNKQIITACRNKPLKEPTISCAGIDVTTTGMHYDLIIGDDLHSEKNTNTKEQIDQVIEHWKLAYSLLDPGKPMIIIGTRWDYNDLYQYILDNERQSFNILIRSAILKDGSLLFPNRLSKQFLDDQKRKQGSRIFSAQYLNEPVDDESATFKRRDIQRIDIEKLDGRPINWYLSVDPSYEGEYSDYAAFVVAGMDYMRQMYVRHVTRSKMTYKGIIDEIFSLYSQYLPKLVVLETIGTQKSIEFELANQMKIRSAWLPLKEVQGMRRSKEERIRGLAPFYEFGRIFHVRGCPQVDELEYELIHFPRGKHDDCVDALATILEFGSPPSPNVSQRRNESARSERPGAHAYKPRNPITGV